MDGITYTVSGSEYTYNLGYATKVVDGTSETTTFNNGNKLLIDTGRVEIQYTQGDRPSSIVKENNTITLVFSDKTLLFEFNNSQLTETINSNDTIIPGTVSTNGERTQLAINNDY